MGGTELGKSAITYTISDSIHTYIYTYIALPILLIISALFTPILTTEKARRGTEKQESYNKQYLM